MGIKDLLIDFIITFVIAFVVSVVVGGYLGVGSFWGIKCGLGECLPFGDYFGHYSTYSEDEERMIPSDAHTLNITWV